MLGSLYFEEFLRAYSYTVLIELAVCYLMNRRFGLKVLAVVLAVNTFSLPFVWFIFPALRLSYLLYLLVAETFAVVSEALLMHKMFPMNVKWAFLTSVTMNMASFAFGILFPWLIL